MAVPQFAVLRITDGTTAVSLLPLNGRGLAVTDWRPLSGDLKAGGYWADSPIADGRRPVGSNLANTIETITFDATADCADTLIANLQDLRRLLVKAYDYWYGWGDEPVWVEAQGYNETNKRYAVIYKGDVPDDGFAYGQPFIPVAGNMGMEDLALVFERGPWLENAPGTGTCVEISGIQSWAYPWHLEFDGDTSAVVVADDAAIQDLHDARLTAEAWVRPDGRGELDLGQVVGKEQWRLGFDGELTAEIVCAVAAGGSATADLLPDAEWHHVALTWDDAAYNYPRIWIDGAEAVYTGTANRNGAIVTDVGDDLLIGNNAAGGQGWDGAVGWVRISDTIRYSAPFTPPSRCAFPVLDAATVALWIREGTGPVIDNAEGTAALDGTATACVWGACDAIFGRSETCNEGEVFIANKHNLAQLTHVIINDAGVWSPNLLGEALPYDLLPAAPFAGDSVYFGIDTGALNSGPFCSLVFDLSAVIFDLTLEWRYWNGGPVWVPLTVQDNTNADGAGSGEPLDTLGVRSVHWIQPLDWAVTAVNGTTGYWIQLHLTGSNIAPAPATQQNRHPYTITWPYIDVAADQVPGDLVALARIKLHNQSSDDPAGGSIALYTSRAIMGVRSVARGTDFTAFLNLADEQNPIGVAVSVGVVGSCSFVADVLAPSGRSVYFDSGLGGAGYVTISFVAPTLEQYIGTYRGFVRLRSIAGLTADTIDMQISFGADVIHRIETVNVTTVQDWLIGDLGTFSTTPRNVLLSDTPHGISIGFTIDGDGDMYLYDVILIPVDEWAADVFVPSYTTTGPIAANFLTGGPQVLDTDSIMNPKVHLRTFSRESGSLYERYSHISNGPAIWQANSQQRLWCLETRTNPGSGVTSAEAYIAHSVQAYRQARYKSMRGAR